MPKLWAMFATSTLLVQLILASSSGSKLEPGFSVQTIFDLRKHSASAHSLLPQTKSLLALDSTGSRVFQLSLPLSLNSSLELLAGSPNGEPGYTDGPVEESLFNHPQSLAVGDNGDIYVADTRNFAVRKISRGQVTTIAGGSSPKAGYVDGPGESARFSGDVGLSYWCGSLLIADRGNGVIREIEVDVPSKSCSSKDVYMKGTQVAWLVVPLVLAGICCGVLVGMFLSSKVNFFHGQVLSRRDFWMTNLRDFLVTSRSMIVSSVSRNGTVRVFLSVVNLMLDQASSFYQPDKTKLVTTPSSARQHKEEQVERLFQPGKEAAAKLSKDLPDLIDLSEKTTYATPSPTPVLSPPTTSTTVCEPGLVSMSLTYLEKFDQEFKHKIL